MLQATASQLDQIYFIYIRGENPKIIMKLEHKLKMITPREMNGTKLHKLNGNSSLTNCNVTVGNKKANK